MLDTISTPAAATSRFSAPVRSLLFAALLVGPAAPSLALADYEAGADAFENGFYDRAIAEWLAAARDGEVKALTRLGKLYEDGYGAPQNFVRAYMYYALAAARGDRAALDARNALGARMTPAQIATAQEQATGWRQEPAETSNTARGSSPQKQSRAARENIPTSAEPFKGDPCNDVTIVAEQLGQNFPDIVSSAGARSSPNAKKPKNDYYLTRATSCSIIRARGQPGDDPMFRRTASYQCVWEYPTPQEAFQAFQPLVNSLKACTPLSLSFVDETSDVRDRGRGAINHKGLTYVSRPYSVAVEVSAYGRKMTTDNTRIEDFSKLTLRVKKSE